MRKGGSCLRTLCIRSDVVIESFSPGKLAQYGFEFAFLQKINPKIILTSITGFGQDGPRSAYKAPDIVCFAMGGPLYPSGERGQAPCVAPGYLVYGIAGAWAAAGISWPYTLELQPESANSIHVSAQEAAAMITDSGITRHAYEGWIIPREGSTYPWITPGDLYPCTDGWVRIVAGQIVHWR